MEEENQADVGVEKKDEEMKNKKQKIEKNGMISDSDDED